LSDSDVAPAASDVVACYKKKEKNPTSKTVNMVKTRSSVQTKRSRQFVIHRNQLKSCMVVKRSCFNIVKIIYDMHSMPGIEERGWTLPSPDEPVHPDMEYARDRLYGFLDDPHMLAIAEQLLRQSPVYFRHPGLSRPWKVIHQIINDVFQELKIPFVWGARFEISTPCRRTSDSVISYTTKLFHVKNVSVIFKAIVSQKTTGALFQRLQQTVDLTSEQRNVLMSAVINIFGERVKEFIPDSFTMVTECPEHFRCTVTEAIMPIRRGEQADDIEVTNVYYRNAFMDDKDPEECLMFNSVQC